MGSKLLRWGILGAANIARKNWKAVWNSGNGCVSAVASRDLRRSRRFIGECQAHAPFKPAPRAHSSYEQLLADPEVDAVYIPLPTGIRGTWVKRAAETGKHVVCEKPCATSVAELTEMLAACRANKVQFMDGVMFMHSRRLLRMREVLDDGQTIGPIKRVTSAFTFRAQEEFFASNIRTQSGLEPEGCLGDLGWYCIRFALWAANWKLPHRVMGQILSEFKHTSSELAVPTEFSGELFFADGVTSSFYCSFLTETEQWANVSGTRGYLRVPDFVLPFSGTRIGFETGNPVFEVHGCDFEMQPHLRRWVVKERSHSHPTAQESQLFRHFAEQVQSGTLNPLWPEMALKTQQVMQACRESARHQGRPVKVDELSGA
ncbi:MAG TPA: Gfo/Idh/MocA family oxidoreductase [Candidatus Acidoferrum sp.]|jgi:predicted dehydrogenase|nr:Gfo/Idh/MocA family oxidoreductase [Candidatus Acidoferrum sp.]